MIFKTFTVVSLIALLLVPYAGAAEPNRLDGLSAHFMPKRAVKPDSNGKARAGFIVPTIGDLVPSPEFLISYYRTLSPAVQENGIWLVVTHPDAYSSDERSMLEKFKALCKKEDIPLFICRGSELPKGWQRVK